ncbi:Crp/Fnr family transcriptional regulator [Mucilaginibacter sp. UR6-1]|uniref:Crp/Fnr family transcriptional regulator n=1 Tax=Mucilaginibacter sp. UR6-1 TaxID=1435643 RepID=UPI001E2E2FDA|nr:Crp/Fnr family transcriptional regulator [Mucilaginibacter sp. UR6-1]MCC8407504.1 Crp/Fnr family transcriptional regulator [Mucilaginibacter sp. UR6-1]
MKELINFILQFGKLNEQQIQLIISKATPVKFAKEGYLTEAGKVPRQVGFLLSGVVRFVYYNNKGQEITHYFVGEGQFVTDYARFETQIVASEYIQAITPCEFLMFEKEDWDEIGNTIVGWAEIESKMAKKCLHESIERRSRLITEDAASRYRSFLTGFEKIASRVPLAYVASYLGITQQSLSRIRKNIR